MDWTYKGLSWAESMCEKLEKICTDSDIIQNSYKYIDAIGDNFRRVRDVVSEDLSSSTDSSNEETPLSNKSLPEVCERLSKVVDEHSSETNHLVSVELESHLCSVDERVAPSSHECSGNSQINYCGNCCMKLASIPSESLGCDIIESKIKDCERFLDEVEPSHLTTPTLVNESYPPKPDQSRPSLSHVCIEHLSSRLLVRSSVSSEICGKLNDVVDEHFSDGQKVSCVELESVLYSTEEQSAASSSDIHTTLSSILAKEKSEYADRTGENSNGLSHSAGPADHTVMLDNKFLPFKPDMEKVSTLCTPPSTVKDAVADDSTISTKIMIEPEPTLAEDFENLKHDDLWDVNEDYELAFALKRACSRSSYKKKIKHALSKIGLKKTGDIQNISILGSYHHFKAVVQPLVHQDSFLPPSYHPVTTHGILTGSFSS